MPFGTGRADRDALEHRQREGRGLAGARRRLGEQVAAGEQQRDGLALDRRRLLVAEVGDGGEQAVVQPEAGKSVRGGPFGARGGLGRGVVARGVACWRVARRRVAPGYVLRWAAPAVAPLGGSPWTGGPWTSRPSVEPISVGCLRGGQLVARSHCGRNRVARLARHTPRMRDRSVARWVPLLILLATAALAGCGFRHRAGAACDRRRIPATADLPPLPFRVTDQTGLIRALAVVEPDGVPEGVSGVPGRDDALYLAWLGGACDRLAMVVFDHRVGGHAFTITTERDFGGCQLVGYPRSLVIEFTQPIDASTESLEMTE